MIIGIDASRANKPNKTGTEWYAFNVIQELKKIKNDQNQYILYSKEKLAGSLSDLPKNFSSRVLKWPLVFLWTQLRLAWEMLLHPPDALFVPAHTLPIICPEKTYITLHDVGFESNQELYSRKNIGPKNKAIQFFIKLIIFLITFGKYTNNELDYHRWSTRLAVKKAKKIFTVSNFSKSEIIKYFPRSLPKINVIYNGLNYNFHKYRDQKLIDKTLEKFIIKKPYIYFIGRLENKKNIAILVKAFLNYKRIFNSELKLVLIGEPGYGFEKVKPYVINPKNEITYLKNVQQEIMPILTSQAKALLFPSNYEGFGMPIIEAMACGTPVITSNFGAMKEISGGAAYLVDPKSIENISCAIHTLFENDKLRLSLIDKGLYRSRFFSWEKTTLEIINHIN